MVFVTSSNSFTVGDAIITETIEGFLKCSEDEGSFWCEHIEQGVRDNKDAQTLWLRRDDSVSISLSDSSDEFFSASIPLVPTLSLWILLDFLPTSFGQSRRIEFKNQHPLDDDHLAEYPPLGFAQPGDGRMIIRTQIIEWFRGVVDVEKLECGNSLHGFAQEMAWEKAVSGGWSSSEYLYHKWWVFDKGQCYFCFNNSLLDLSEYVPETDAAGWSNPVGGF